MKKLHDRNPLAFALIWIGIYVVLLSAADGISGQLGIAKVITAPLSLAMTAILLLWTEKNGLWQHFGLQAFAGEPKQFLYFVPLALLVSVNLWWGFDLGLSPLEAALAVVSMLCVGFLEELIFRGFLFKALCKDNLKLAVIISSITFGLGHIVNLLNGSNPLLTGLQIVYAICAGFLFTVILLRGKSLWPCILTHSALNSLSIFSREPDLTGQLLSAAFLCVLPLAYSFYILKKADKRT